MADGTTLDKINIEIEANADNASAGIEKLAEALKKLQSATTGSFDGLDRVAKKISHLSYMINSVDLSKLREMTKLLGKLGSLNVKMAPPEMPSPPTQAPLPQILGSDGNPLPKMKEQGDGLTDLERETDAYLERQRKLREESERLAESTDELSTEQENLDGVTKQTGKGMQMLKNAIFGASDAANSSRGKFDKFFKSLKRIATYRMIRWALKQITQALTEGIQNYAMYSDEFNDVMSGLKSGLSTLKNSLGSAIAPIIESLAPILNAIIDALIYAMNGLTYFFALLSGSDSVTIATRQQEDYRDSIEDTKKSLMGFDEINALSNDTDYSSMYETISMTDVALGDMLGGMATFVAAATALVSLFTGSGLLTALEDVCGVLMVIQGVMDLMNIDWTSPDWYNTMEEALEGVGLVLAGVGLLFDSLAATVVGLVGSVSLLGSGIMDMCENGMSIENVTTVVMGLGTALIYVYKIMKKGNNFSITSFGGVASAITGIVTAIMALISVFQNWDTLIENNQWYAILMGIAAAGFAVASAFCAIFQKWVKASICGAIATALAVGTICITGFASGGFPDEGQLFIANEAGPELVGTMGGHTAVANNDQIVAGIKQGVREALEESNVGGGDITVQFVQDGQIKASKIISAAERANQRAGKVVMEVNA